MLWVLQNDPSFSSLTHAPVCDSTISVSQYISIYIQSGFWSDLSK